MNDLFRSLISGSNAAAFTAAAAHALSLMVASAAIGPEFLYIAFATYLIAFVCAMPVGLILLWIVSYFKLGNLGSFILFLSVITFVMMRLLMFLFESELSDVPWQYIAISLPATLAAWYVSVYSAGRSG